MSSNYRGPNAADEETYPTYENGSDAKDYKEYPLRQGSAAGYKDDDPFAGDDQGSGIRYRTLSWWQAGFIMIAETISLGVLSLPSVLERVGFAPGVVLIIGLGTLATYSGYVLGQFKIKYPSVHTFADAMEIVCAPIGLGLVAKEFIGFCQVVFWIFLMGSHVLTWNIMLNTLTGHPVCTIVWGVIGMIVLWIFTLPRTMKNVSWLSICSFISILSSVLITMIDVGIVRPGAGRNATNTTAFYKGFGSASNIIFAYAGHVGFFSFISELRDLRDYPKALYMLQITDTSLYVVAAVVIYYYAGSGVTSPALGSASPDVVKKVGWGIAIPTIIIAGIVNAHVASKYVYVRLFRGTPHLRERKLLSRGTIVWILLTITGWVLAWIIAESIPVFNDLLSLITSLFASWFTYGLSGVFWIFMNWGQLFSSPRKMLLLSVNILLFLIGLAACGIGLYASGKSIHDEGSAGESAWSCADNGQ